MVGVRNPCAEAVLKLYLIANIGDRARLAVLPRKAAEFGSEPAVRPIHGHILRAVRFGLGNGMRRRSCVCRPSIQGLRGRRGLLLMLLPALSAVPRLLLLGLLLLVFSLLLLSSFLLPL